MIGNKGLKACWSWDGIHQIPVESVCIRQYVSEEIVAADWSACRGRFCNKVGVRQKALSSDAALV
jgi:hypothetical protein